MKAAFAVLLLGAVAHGSEQTPIQKVVTLVTEMKAQTIKEGEDDSQAYDKYKCWCVTSEAEKTAATQAAETKLQELSSFVEEAAAKEGQLKTEIAGLEDDIAADKDALASATSMRAEENGEFKAEEADFKETIGLLGEAVAILSKVQLLQKQHKPTAQALLQVRNIVKHVSPKFGGVMQKDLFDLLGEFDGAAQRQQSKAVAAGSFLGEVFLPKREATALEQGSIPTGYNADGSVTSEEDLAKATNPNSEAGAAAGSKSYNSRSGGILGLLKAQGDEFASKLAAATKSETQSQNDFQALVAAKSSEIAAATTQKDNKELELAELMDKAAKAKEDIESTTATLGADQAFLVEMTKNCASEDAEYAKRTAVRNKEVEALSETLNILTGDEARTLFGKTMSFLQVGSVVNQAAAQEVARTKAMQKIMKVSRKNKNWMLATLAVTVKLDAFTKVKAAIDKMAAELRNQQKEEVVKHDTCKTDIDATEDKIWTANNLKSDLADKSKDEGNTLKVLTTDIAELTNEVAEAEVSLKSAGEQRKAQNGLFQAAMADQRATIQILTMAQERLKEFYAPKGASMVQAKLHVQAASSVAPPPPKPAGYEKSASSGGVMQLLALIIADCGRTEAQLGASENEAQAEYAEYVAATTASIEADREAQMDKEKQAAQTKGEQAETSEAQLGNGASIDKLNELLRGHHGECDFLLKYFEVRQTARAEEIDSIEGAKAILSGADFA